MGGHKGKYKQQEHPVCLFCGNRPVTKEHFWPRWLKKIMPEIKSNVHFTKNITESGPAPYIQLSYSSKTTKLTGPYHSEVIKKFCATCNNGWMGDIEYNASPFLTPLILNNPVILTIENQERICEWVFLKMICQDYLPKNDKSISLYQREDFFKSKKLPSYLKIWVGKTDTFFNEPFDSQKLSNQIYYSLTTNEERKHSSNSSTFIIGNLFIHAAMFLVEGIPNVPSNVNYELMGQFKGSIRLINPLAYDTIDTSELKPIIQSEWIRLKDNLATFSDNFFDRIVQY